MTNTAKILLFLPFSSYPYNFAAGAFSRAPSSARSALITFSTCASNFCGSCPHPVKSAASRARTGFAFPLFHFPLSRCPSRFNGISANTFCLRSFMSWRSFSNALSISLSTHQWVPQVRPFFGLTWVRCRTCPRRVPQVRPSFGQTWARHRTRPPLSVNLRPKRPQLPPVRRQRPPEAQK